MQRIIELLKELRDNLGLPKLPKMYLAVVVVSRVIAFLQEQHYLTPEQYKAETGKEWPDNAAVYTLNGEGALISSWGLVKKMNEHLNGKQKIIAICAYLNDGPPPNDWRPE